MLAEDESISQPVPSGGRKNTHKMNFKIDLSTTKSSEKRVTPVHHTNTLQNTQTKPVWHDYAL